MWKMKSIKTLAFTLLVLNLGACAHGPERIERPIEGWKIDYDDAVLYRVVSPVSESYLPIKGNKDMKKFMCFETNDQTEIILRSNP